MKKMVLELKKIGLVFFTLILMSGIVVCADEKSPSDSLVLDTVEINGHRYQAHSSINLIDVNSSQNKFQDLGSLVGQAGISVRSNGVGQLTLASIRGLYGNQMNLLWEGMNIQSPMNGNFDLSLIPAFFLDKASVIQNNYSSLSGNSALSGSIAFGSNKAVFEKNEYSVHLGVGSFGRKTAGTDVKLGVKNLYSRTRIFATESENNYPILGYEQTPFRKRQINNDFLSYGLMQEFALKTGKIGLLNLKFWYQETDRGLTDAISVPNPKSRQQDEIKRIYIDWESTAKNKTYIKTAVFDEVIVFSDNQSNVYHNHAQTLVFDFGQSIMFGKSSRLNFGVNETVNKGIVIEYNGNKIQNLFSAFASFESRFKKLNYTLSVREQLHDDNLLMPAPALEVYTFIKKNLKLRASSGLSYRIPTFNDLYWTPGGNTDLVNERAFKNEIGADNMMKNLILSISAYHNEVDNLIVWQDNGTFWEAYNIRGARVLGIELKFKTLLIDKEKTELSAGAFGSLNHSIYTRTETGSEDIIGNQLIFIPVKMANAFADFKFRNYYVNVNSNYTGMRFISTDNSSFLDGYFTADVKTGYKIKMKNKVECEIGLAVNNIFNKAYELYLGRPMMGRSFLVNLNVKI